MLFVVGAINYMDRSSIGILAPMVTKAFEMTPFQLGVVFSVFNIGYAIFAFVGGSLADKYGPRRVYSWAAFGWSLFCGLTGAVTGFVQLMFVRLVFGFTEGPMCSTNNRAITNWFPRKETSRAVGFIWSGQAFGAVIAAPVVGLLGIAFGWRLAFIIVGLIGFVWVAAWRVLMTDYPRENRRVSKEEIEYIDSNRIVAEVPATGEQASLKALLTSACILALTLAMFADNYAQYIFLTWLPTYMMDALHMNIKEMVFVAAIPWACGFIGYLGGGFVCDYVYNKMNDKLAARKLAIVVPLGVSAIALILLIFSTTAAGAVTLLALAVAMLTMASQGCWATFREVVPEQRLGGVSGYIHMLSQIAGVIGPTITGIGVQYFHSYNSTFWIVAILSIAAILAVWVFVRWPAQQATAAAAA
jgi:MFS family permease